MNQVQESVQYQDCVKADVLNMYINHPYPSYSREERKNIFAAELCRYRFLGLEPFLAGAQSSTSVAEPATVFFPSPSISE